MADEHLWTDLGGGLMGSHQISDELRWASTGENRVRQFALPIPNFKKNAGETITMYHVMPIPDSLDATLTGRGRSPGEDAGLR